MASDVAAWPLRESAQQRLIARLVHWWSSKASRSVGLASDLPEASITGVRNHRGELPGRRCLVAIDGTRSKEVTHA